jgi:S1/P1 Nuclease
VNRMNRKYKGIFGNNSLFVLKMILILGLFPKAAFGWHDLGHMIVGDIAEKILESDKKTKDAIAEIIGIEPMSVSAIWPDLVKKDDRFKDFAPLHYLNIGDSAPQSALTALKSFQKIMQNQQSSREAKMIAYRYVVHIIGDIHQPLHVGDKSDLGGNLCKVFVVQKFSKKTSNLHAVWDGLLVELIGQSYVNQEYINGSHKVIAEKLMTEQSATLKNPQVVDIDGWMTESNNLMRKSAYPAQPIRMVNGKVVRPYCKPNDAWGTIQDKDVPTVDTKFIDERSPIVKAQLVLAGARLAAYLKETFSSSNSTGLDETKIIKELIK